MKELPQPGNLHRPLKRQVANAHEKQSESSRHSEECKEAAASTRSLGKADFVITLGVKCYLPKGSRLNVERKNY